MAPNWAGSDEHQRGGGGLVKSDAGETTKIFSGKTKKSQGNFPLLLRRIYLIAAAEHNLGQLSATAALGLLVRT